MEVVVIGLNHKTAPIALREKLSIPKDAQPAFLNDLCVQKIFSERVVLSTCNRTEIYGAGNNTFEDIKKAKKFLSAYAQVKEPEFEKQLYVLSDPFSVRHLFSVSAGLNSMVVGETEITGQVKDAYQLAQELGATGKALNRLFQQAFKVTKDIRSKTQIGAKKVSIASVAVDLAEKSFNGLNQLKVMVLGSGKMSTQVVRAMTQKGAVPIIVSRCPLGHGNEIAMELNAQIRSYESFQEDIPTVDILIASTGAGEILIKKEKVASWISKRKNKPLLLIDIAVPRNIAADAGDLNDVYLYNIDALQKIADQNHIFRESQIIHSFEMIQAQTQNYSHWLLQEYSWEGYKLCIKS